AYCHSSCFDIAEIEANLAEGGLWDRFLRRSPESFDEVQRWHPAPWRPVRRPARAAVRVVGVGLIVAVAGLALTHVSIAWLRLPSCAGLKRIGYRSGAATSSKKTADEW